jgi:group I intron endonuclease
MSEISLKATGVYKIQNIVNGKIYIGSAQDTFGRRFSRHKSDLRNNIHHCHTLQRSWNKYGPDKFIFVPLFQCESEECIGWEQHFFDLYQPWPETNEGYNLCRIAGCGSSNSRTFVLISPQGKIVEGHNISAFCRDKNLPSSSAVTNVVNGKLKSYMGWTRCFEDYLILKYFGSFISYQKSKIKFYTLVDSEGKIHKIYNSKRFAEENSLGYPAVIDLKNGKSKVYKGWTRTLEDHEKLKNDGCISNTLISKYLKNEQGQIVKIASIKDFCEKYKLTRNHVSRLINKHQQKYRGWTLSSEEEYKEQYQQ